MYTCLHVNKSIKKIISFVLFCLYYKTVLLCNTAITETCQCPCRKWKEKPPYTCPIYTKFSGDINTDVLQSLIRFLLMCLRKIVVFNK